MVDKLNDKQKEEISRMYADVCAALDSIAVKYEAAGYDPALFAAALLYVALETSAILKISREKVQRCVDEFYGRLEAREQGHVN